MTTMIEIGNSASTATDTPITLARASTPSSHQGPAIASIPKGQAYFWSAEWQQLEREASEDLENGDFVEFADPIEALRWLLSGDD